MWGGGRIPLFVSEMRRKLKSLKSTPDVPYFPVSENEKLHKTPENVNSDD